MYEIIIYTVHVLFITSKSNLKVNRNDKSYKIV